MGWVKRLLVTLLVLVVMAIVFVALYAQRALPVQDGAIKLTGAEGPIQIGRDEHGIPSIKAGNLRDLAFGLGVVHAQDRLWQLETHRRIGAGRMAEAFGEAALDGDRFLRALGVRRAAAAQWAQTQGEARELLLAYAKGINAVVREQMGARPPEFVLLGLGVEDWDPVDSLAWGIMMAWDLGGNWSSELLRLRLALQMPVQRIQQLLPPYPGEAPLATADYSALLRSLNLSSRIQQGWMQLPTMAPESGIEGVGSNNWVLAGSRTTSGQPLLANDPHLKLSAPALWYFARLEAPGIKVAGATMPGLPLVVLGQNEHIAWGFTNTGPDVQDLYIEQIKPDDPTQYRTPEGWARFETVSETIRVKGKADVPVSWRRTRHGPVISDAGVTDDVLGAPARAAYVLAMRWTALDADAAATGVSLAMQRATSVESFVSATQGFVAPMQNMAVADRQGHIGFVAPGRVPLRKPDNDLRGLVPAPGWDARYDWAGWVPAAETPREFDPARGWVATANQRVHGADYPHFITSEWASPYRQQRIEQMLEAKPKHSIDDLARLQGDVKSLAAVRLLPWLRNAKTDHALANEVAKVLATFDGTMNAEDAAPLIFWAWVRHLTELVFADDLGSALWQRILGRSFREGLEGVLERTDGTWCDNIKTTDVVESCQQMNNLALTRALDELQQRYGSEVTRWRWGAAHISRSEHRPFSRVAALARFFELRTRVGGDTFTVNVSRVGLKPDATTGELYLSEHAASLRALYDLGDPAQSRFMHSSGQSGIFFSPLYRSFVKPWAEVAYVPLWGAGVAVHTLSINPAAR